MTTEAMRAQFEAWSQNAGGYSFDRKPSGRYADIDTVNAWQGYQAALRSPAVAGLMDAGDFLATNGTPGMVRRWNAAKAALANFTGDKP